MHWYSAFWSDMLEGDCNRPASYRELWINRHKLTDVNVLETRVFGAIRSDPFGRCALASLVKAARRPT